MKFIFVLLIVMSFATYADDTKITTTTQTVVSDSALQADIKSNPLATKNKAVAEFGEFVVSKSFTYAKAVRDVSGHKIVDVVILDKLCHVTVDESSGKMRASKIECDEGRYIPASAKNN